MSKARWMLRKIWARKPFTWLQRCCVCRRWGVESGIHGYCHGEKWGKICRQCGIDMITELSGNRNEQGWAHLVDSNISDDDGFTGCLLTMNYMEALNCLPFMKSDHPDNQFWVESNPELPRRQEIP